MKAFKVLLGLLVDDGRLASILMISLVVAYAVSTIGHAPAKLAAAGIIWLGLILSLWISVRHELRSKLTK